MTGNPNYILEPLIAAGIGVVGLINFNRPWRQIKNPKFWGNIFRYFYIKVTHSYLFKWVEFNLFRRYHIVNVRNFEGPYGYRCGWIEHDHLMFLACFKILVDFVEKERPELIGQQWQPETYETDREITNLYNWWTVDRVKAWEDLETRIHNEAWPPNRPKGKEQFKGQGKKIQAYYEAREALLEKENEMFLRLAKVRPYLWS